MDIATLPVRRQTTKRPVPTYEQRVRALIDFWTFVDIINFHGGSKNFGQCHYELMEWSRTNNSLKELVLMPRGHLKSTLKTVAETLWEIYRNPNVRIFVGTATGGLASAFVREVKTYLEDEFLQEHVWNNRPHIPGKLIPLKDKLYRRMEDTEAEDKKIVWKGDAIQVNRTQILKEPTVVVGAVGIQPTGFHYDVLKLDDVVNFDNISPKKAEKVMAWIHDLINVLDSAYVDEEVTEYFQQDFPGYTYINGGRITAVGTRYDSTDWYGQILAGKDANGYAIYIRNIYKNGQDNTDGYLWHETWDERVEQDKRANMTAIRFASQYLNEIMVPEEQVLSTELLHYFNNETDVKWIENGRRVEITHSSVIGDDKLIIRPMMVVDPAAIASATADFTCIMVGGVDDKKRLVILDFRMGRWRPELTLKHMYELADKWHLQSVTVENVGGFQHFVEYIRAAFSRFRPIGIVEYKPSGEKKQRIANALEPLFSNGLVYMSRYPFANTQQVKDQLNYFPRDTMNDDFPDAMAMIAEVSRPFKQKVKRQFASAINTLYGGIR